MTPAITLAFDRNTVDSTPFLWYSNDTLYAPTSSDIRTPLGSFNTTTNLWSYVNVSGSNVNLTNQTSDILASVPSSGLAFSLISYSWDTNVVVPEFITFNFSSAQFPTWYKQTMNGYQGIQVPNVSRSELVHLPMGNEGVLLLIGGEDVSVK